MTFREDRIDGGEWDHVERGVPCSEPWILPFIRHREDIAGIEILPIRVTTLCSVFRRDVVIPLQPLLDDVVEKLLGPKQSRVALPADEALVVGDAMGDDLLVKLIALSNSLRE